MNGNTWIGYGRFTKDPELKTLEGGMQLCSFTIAINRIQSKEKDHPEADFIDCVAWRHNAEFICNYFKKGMRIAITGRLQTRTWEDKDGNKRKGTEVVVDTANFIDPKSTNPAGESSSDDSSHSYASSPASPASPSYTSHDDGEDDDDLPF
jgi:single-strand DNA-binding protein